MVHKQPSFHGCRHGSSMSISSTRYTEERRAPRTEEEASTGLARESKRGQQSAYEDDSVAVAVLHQPASDATRRLRLWLLLGETGRQTVTYREAADMCQLMLMPCMRVRRTPLISDGIWRESKAQCVQVFHKPNCFMLPPLHFSLWG